MPMMKELLQGRLIVSCQAAPLDPLDDTETLRRMARAVVAAGAAGLRLNSAEHIAAIRQDTDVPIIGIQKRYFGDELYITPDFASAEALAKAGASIIALDCTEHAQSHGEPWPELIERIHGELKLPVMADVATLDEAVAAAVHGADFAGTTLYGYTPRTAGHRSFNWAMLEAMVRESGVPVIAEGHIATPEDARRAIELGAWSVVVGSAITRPGNITANFIRAMEPRDTGRTVIGVDIGGTMTKAAIVAASGEITSPAQVTTNASGGRDSIAAALTEAIEQVTGTARAQNIEISGLGIASAGVIEAESGRVFAATENLPQWAGFPLGKFAEERFGLSARVVNDAQAAVLAELHYGKGRGRRNFVAITVGTGVGGGIVCNGKLVRGQYGFGGTLGHQVIVAGGRRCNCGRRGCLEAYVSTSALIAEFKSRGGAVAEGSASDDAALALRIQKLSNAGDTAARGAYEALVGYLAEGIANLFNVLDPELVILSGGLLAGYPELVATLQERVAGSLHCGSMRQPKIEISDAGQYAGVQGAAALFLES